MAGMSCALCASFSFPRATLDGCLLVGRDLVAQLLQLLLRLEDGGVGLVQLVDALLGHPVGFRVGGCLFLHPLDLVVAQAR